MVKFPPEGSRGVDGVNAVADIGLLPRPEYPARANRETFIVAQIEEPAALERLDEIAAVKGVDVLLVGPADLSVQLGIPGQLRDRRILDAFDKVARACQKHGKRAGTTTGDPEDARKLIERGYLFFGTSIDYAPVRSHMLKLKETFGPVGFTFGA
jgi:2-keto-3-deoxy-L-rhamnonate aldolase RhmA